MSEAKLEAAPPTGRRRAGWTGWRAGSATAGPAAGFRGGPGPAAALRSAPQGLSLELPPLPLPPGTPVVFDLSRLIGAARRPFATGIDRIDLAVARQLLARRGAECRFVTLWSEGLRPVHPALARRFLDRIEARWRGRGVSVPPRWALRAPAAWPAPGAVYVNAGHGGALRDPAARALLRRCGIGARLVYLHDLIPLEAPCTQTAAGRAKFSAFLDGLADAPFHAAVNSADTAARLRALAAVRGLALGHVAQARPVLRPLPPGPLPPRAAEILAAPGPLFVTLGTVEPRKNHALLLDLWEDFARRPPFGPAAAPLRLLALGRRGWADPALAARLCAPPPHVRWIEDASDAEVAALLTGACALLAPSTAEGLHLPSLEAAALGVPALVSDLPALHEAAPPDRIFLPPDPAAWRAAVLRRAAQAAGGAAAG